MSNIRPELRPIDPRGPRFGAGVTTVVLAAILVLGPHSPMARVLLTIQLLAFAAGAVLGLQAQPYGWLFRKAIRPRLSPPAELEAPEPPRFAQAVGLIFALVATVGLIIGAPVVFYLAIGAALGAAFLNAVFNYCLGCEMYLLLRRVTGANKSEPRTIKVDKAPSRTA